MSLHGIAPLNAALAGRYRIERELGAGGMATVYLTQDIRHDRHVALKVLRPELAAVIGAERFLHEIKTTANLQHPHILPLHDSGEVEGTVFYVMPYVEGESLRERIRREKQLPVDDAVRIAREVADALDYAHRHGVIHRDIKPENILLHDGRAQVADFGIALAVSRSDGGTRMTETGMSLGTPHYMSPEQAMGDREISARADVYALGCVLYEMLAGEPPFTGPTAQAIIARVVTEEPRGLTIQRKTIPPHVEAAVRKALEKLPADRFAAAADFANALGDVGFGTRPSESRPLAAAPVRDRRPVVIMTVVAAVLGAAALWGWLRKPPATAAVRFEIPMPDSARTVNGVTVTPDGSRIIVFANGRGYVRPIGDITLLPIAGLEQAEDGFLSPDGAEIGFTTRNTIRAIPLVGGAARTVADTGFDGSWGADGMVYFGSWDNAVSRVPAGGGPVEVLVKADSGPNVFPQLLPDKRSVLYTMLPNGQVDSAQLRIFDLTSRKVKTVTLGWYGRYLPSGHLAFARNGFLLAAPFDMAGLKLTATAVPVLEQLGATPAFAVGGGTLAVSTSAALTAFTPVVVSRSGVRHIVPNLPPNLTFGFPRISPDGRRAAFKVTDQKGQGDIWVYTLPSGPLTRLTFSGRLHDDPSWTPDGKRIAYNAVRDSVRKLYIQAADGSGDPELLSQAPTSPWTSEWLPDGKRFLFSAGLGAYDIGIGTVGSPDTVRMLASSKADERRPSVSPDGRFFAYQSNESGRQEVYVRAVDGAGRWQVSSQGGTSPRWSRGGRAVYFRHGDSLYAADVEVGSAVTVSGERALMSLASTVDQWYDVLPGDTAFVMVGSTAPDKPDRVIVVLNFLDDLKRRFKK